MSELNPRAEVKSQLPIEVRRKVEQLCAKFERELEAKAGPRIEDFLKDVSSRLRSLVLRKLLTVELRTVTVDAARVGEYNRRFPDDMAVVAAVIEEKEGCKSKDLSRQSTNTLTAETEDARVREKRRTDVKQPVPEELGRYEVRQVLGEGLFGRVYLGYDPQLDRLVALKVPGQQQVDAAESVASFVEEARNAARLKHPGLVPVYDVQQEGAQPYIVQEYIDGGDLGEWAREHQPARAAIVALFIEVTEAVGYAHQHGLIHRDLKPTNILVDTASHAHVADFGLAVHESTQRARRGEVSGSPAYMSPEQVRGETHRLDGRTDIWSLGVILYELLLGRKPFQGETPDDLFTEIESLDPRPLRQLSPDVPKELERICLKCLEKRRVDRYASAADLLEDLRQCLDENSEAGTPSSAMLVAAEANDSGPTLTASSTSELSPTLPRIIPKGLRSFDRADADFFLDLLSGPRDRDGLPESIRFWKMRIEETDSDETFSVGLIYGPSGCGKSSFVKAGLLPRLATNVVPIYIEATPDETEVRLRKGIAKRFPMISNDKALPEFVRFAREQSRRGQKILLVIDQFEQWLHAHGGEATSQLVQALRHCDGGRVQCVVLVRDDFWMAVTRFMRDLEIQLLEGQNSNPVDLFPLRHAEQVLIKFGQAFDALPQDEPTQSQRDFVTQSIQGLSEQGKVVCVRLALFADMMKDKPWTIASLQEVGGTEGVGIVFLEETFSASTAAPEHRFHQRAARGVLKALLPDSGSNIKGYMRSHDELLELSGYANRQRDFTDLIRILDSELRLITPTDPEGQAMEEGNQEGSIDLTREYYQLTHDYLVPSLRDWLSRKQRETRRGRAEIRLAELSDVWNRKPENRNLPSSWELLNIRFLCPFG